MFNLDHRTIVDNLKIQNSTMNCFNISWSIQNFHPDKDYFSGLYASSPFKLIAVTLSVTFSLILLPCLFGMIWKERYGLDIKRIITNRLICSLAWNCIVYITFIQSLEIFRHIYGPYPELFCFYYHLLRNVVQQQIQVLVLLIVLFRYIFIFWLKNPMAFEDKFWSCFIKIWLALFCIISQWLIVYLPGNHPISFYFCTGHNPSKNSLSFVPKSNILLNTLNKLLVVVLFAMYFRIEIFKWKETNLTTWLQNQKSLFLKDIEDKFLASYFMYMVTILNSIVTLILITKINSFKQVESNFYPNSLYIMSYQLISPLQLIGAGTWAYYREHGNFISIFFLEVKDNIRPK